MTVHHSNRSSTKTSQHSWSMFALGFACCGILLAITTNSSSFSMNKNHDHHYGNGRTLSSYDTDANKLNDLVSTVLSDKETSSANSAGLTTTNPSLRTSFVEDVLKKSTSTKEQHHSSRRMDSIDNFSCMNPEWSQVGDDIEGDGASDYAGWSVALSADGNTVVVGIINHDDNGTNSGKVRVYQRIESFNSTEWIQIGEDLEGEGAGDNFGYSVAISDDGDVIAAGARYNDGSASNSGHVRVFERDASSALGWTQLGQDLDGEEIYDEFGTSIALSGDGKVLAVGALYNDENGSNSGHVRVYETNSTVILGWAQVGGDLDGELASDYSGSAVSLSNNGNVVAIGAYYNDGAGSNSGHVRVYKRDQKVPLGWAQDGGDIDGEAAADESGFSVALSDNGQIVAIGARYNDGNGASSGHVRVYERDPCTYPVGWTQIGGDIDGEYTSDYSGWGVAISGDGEIVAIGARYNDGNGGSSGHVRVYLRDIYAPNGWIKVGDDLDGENAYDEFGYSVSMSRNGEVVASGGIYNDDGGTNSGHVRVFEACDQSSVSPPTPTTPMPTPSPVPCIESEDDVVTGVKCADLVGNEAIACPYDLVREKCPITCGLCECETCSSWEFNG